MFSASENRIRDSGVEEEPELEQGRKEQTWCCQSDILQWEECGTLGKDSLHKEEAVVNLQPRLEDLGGLHTYFSVALVVG